MYEGFDGCMYQVCDAEAYMMLLRWMYVVSRCMMYVCVKLIFRCMYVCTHECMLDKLDVCMYEWMMN